MVAIAVPRGRRAGPDATREAAGLVRTRHDRFVVKGKLPVTDCSFKVGDRVTGDHLNGTVYVVTEVDMFGGVYLRGHGGPYKASLLKLA